MRTIFRTILICYVPLMAIVGSCTTRREIEPGDAMEEEKISRVNQMSLLGKQLQNPYSVVNMQKAYDNLSQSNARLNEHGVKVKTTHLYIKFKPKSESELEILKDDSTIVLYSYPLDYEISPGTYYRDPNVPQGRPTYQYCAVPVEKQLPVGVAHEILEELYIPDEYKDGPASNVRMASEESIMALVNEALRITGNLDEVKSGARITNSSWRPAGRVRVWDDDLGGWRGVGGVIVKARRWFTTHSGMVDDDGNYSCDGTFRHSANYSLDWERYHFALREGWLDGANINGPKMDEDWDLDFERDDVSAFHAKVFIAAYHYYYSDIKGLRRPPENGFFKTQMHIRCYNEPNGDKGNHMAIRRAFGLGSAVHIYNPRHTISAIYGTTTHELAHASHWNMSSGGDFSHCEDKVAESWARGVQWELTRMIWSNYPGGKTALPKYTQVVVDMIDGPNDSSNNGEKDLSEDGVDGYSISEIEDALLGQRTWNDWRENIKNRYDNGTENNLEALFIHWNH